MVISLSRIRATFCLLFSSECLQNLQIRVNAESFLNFWWFLQVSYHTKVWILSKVENKDQFLQLKFQQLLEKGTLDYLVRFGNQGVMYSRHKCFISMLEFPNPWIHSSRNSNVRCGSLTARVSLISLMKMVLLAGIHNPVRKTLFSL